jgi:adenine-specific DNA-methyltransferase
MKARKHLSQPSLFGDEVHGVEDPSFLSEQLITYIGNKRSLLPAISEATEKVCAEIGRDRIRVFDGFAGSGVVSRLFKTFASEIVSNDLESYARIIGECFLTNQGEVDLTELSALVDQFNQQVDEEARGERGFIERLYAPADEHNVRLGERVFYTPDNARRLDSFRSLIEPLPPKTAARLLGPLLSSASVHANTAGVFKGFYKDKVSGVGKLGGSGADALERITGQIRMRVPVLSRFSSKAEIHQMDANALVDSVGDFDLAYFDPPYNQHPYGSNYFMLNLLVDYREPTEVSKVSGIPEDWTRSPYNMKRMAFERLQDLVLRVDARYVLLSFNDEGFIQPGEMREFLSELGPVDEVQQKHNTFRGSRNLRNRSMHVTEHLYLLRKLEGV